MPETVGRSVYLSETDDSVLSSSMLDDAPVFLSLHRQEVMDGQYAEKMKAFLEKLHEKRCRIIADISKRTLGAFGVSSEEELMDLLFLYAVRLDYGYDMQEILRLSKTRNVVINASTLRPLDGDMLRALHEKGVPVFTVEEHMRAGGFGEAVAAHCVRAGLTPPRGMLAIDAPFVPHGSRAGLLRRLKLDAEGIAETIRKAVKP